MSLHFAGQRSVNSPSGHTPNSTRSLGPHRRESAAPVRLVSAREAETLRSLAACDFPYASPELITVVRDDAGAVVGLIESALDGTPLAYLASLGRAEFCLRAIAGVAPAIHDLPVSQFAHLPRFADSAAHVGAELAALPAAVFDWPIAAAARDWITAHLPNRILRSAG